MKRCACSFSRTFFPGCVFCLFPFLFLFLFPSSLSFSLRSTPISLVSLSWLLSDVFHQINSLLRVLFLRGCLHNIVYNSGCAEIPLYSAWWPVYVQVARLLALFAFSTLGHHPFLYRFDIHYLTLSFSARRQAFPFVIMISELENETENNNIYVCICTVGIV